MQEVEWGGEGRVGKDGVGWDPKGEGFYVNKKG